MFSIPLSEDDKRILLNKALLIVENLDREEVRPIEIYAVMYLWDRELLRRFGIFDWGSSYRAQDNGVIHQDLQSIIYSDYDLVGEYFEVRHGGEYWLKASGLVDEDYLSGLEVSVFESAIKPKMSDFCEERLRKACTGMAWRKAIRSYGMLVNPLDM